MYFARFQHKLKTFLFGSLSTTAHRDCLLFCVIEILLFTYLLTYFQVEDALYSRNDIEKFMKKLDGLVASNEPESIARYVNDVAAVTNSQSAKNALTKDERQEVLTAFCVVRPRSAWSRII